MLLVLECLLCYIAWAGWMTQHPANHTGGRLSHLNRHQEDRHDANEEERGGVDEAADHVLAQGLDDEGHEGVHLYCVCVWGGGGGVGGMG